MARLMAVDLLAGPGRLPLQHPSTVGLAEVSQTHRYARRLSLAESGSHGANATGERLGDSDRVAAAAPPRVNRATPQPRISRTTSPCTSVRRKSRPA